MKDRREMHRTRGGEVEVVAVIGGGEQISEIASR